MQGVYSYMIDKLYDSDAMIMMLMLLYENYMKMM